MKRIRVFDSTSISSIAYDEKKKILEIIFIPAGTYHYLKVRHSMYKSLLKAASKGEFVNKFIKWSYDNKKVD